MEAPSPRNTVARYLAGQAVAAADLAAAREALVLDPVFSRYLRRELAALPEEPSPCEVFSHRVAEYSELSASDQVAQFPAQASHVAECEACQALVASVRPFVPRTVAKGTPGGSWQAAAKLSLTIAASGEVSLAAPAPAFTVREAPQPVGGLLELATPTLAGLGMRQIWTICDEYRGIEIQLTIAALDDEFSLRVDFLADEQPLTGDDLRLEVWDEARESCQLSGPGSQFLSHTFRLPRGAWWVVVIRRTAQRQETWEVPLQVEAEDGE
jgi:hypothetical protein